MTTNRPRRPARRARGYALALLALASGTALAAVPSTTAYRFSSHPMIAGTVVTVNDHQMVVDTDQGERVTLEVDSRTMAPRDLAPGMIMRADFLALEDCRFYAQRVVPIRGGMSLDRPQAYGQTRDLPGRVEHTGRLPEARREDPPGPVMTAVPTTADYQFSTSPMISGRVVSVNDHRLVVETDQGQHVGLVMDSRTMVPVEVAPGATLRVKFTQLKDGRYYARRISRTGNSIADREQAYAHTRDNDVLMAGNMSDCGFVNAATGTTTTSTLERRVVTPAPEAVVARSAAEPVAQSAPQPQVERAETLPQTASNRTLILLLGVSAVGAAGLVAAARSLGMV